MNITEMRALVRRDLHDEDAPDYRWSDNEIDRHLARAVKELSEAVPLEQKATIATTAGSRDLSISVLTDRVTVEAVEYPVDRFPKSYQRFSLWSDVITLLGPDVPDGSNCCIYYGKLHTLDGSSSTIPAKYEDLIAAGAAGYAALEQGIYSINKVNTGGDKTPGEWEAWGKARIEIFRSEIKRPGRRNRVRAGRLYTPYNPPVSKSTDSGPV